MVAQIKRVLPGLAIVGALIALTCFGVISQQRKQALIDTGETRISVEATLTKLRALHPANPHEPSFIQAVERAAHARYVAYIWLFGTDGRVIFTNARFAGNGNVVQQATAETARLLDTLPPDLLNPTQRMQLLVASAIQREGEHNDVFRHLVRPLQGRDGSQIGLLGVTYDVNPGISKSPPLSYKTRLLAIPMGFLIYWLALPLWVYLDARERGDRGWVWAMFVLIGNVVAIMSYILSRPPLVRLPSPVRPRRIPVDHDDSPSVI